MRYNTHNLSDLELDRFKVTLVKSNGAIGLLTYGFLLMFDLAGLLYEI